MSLNGSAGGSNATDDSTSLEQLAVQLMDRAQAQGVSLVGPGGLLSGLTKTVLESALEEELTEHVGYEPYDPAGRHSGNSRNGTRKKTVVTEIEPVELEVRAHPSRTTSPEAERGSIVSSPLRGRLDRDGSSRRGCDRCCRSAPSIGGR
jgi:hypothetical protein